MWQVNISCSLGWDPGTKKKEKKRKLGNLNFQRNSEIWNQRNLNTLWTLDKITYIKEYIIFGSLFEWNNTILINVRCY